MFWEVAAIGGLFSTGTCGILLWRGSRRRAANDRLDLSALEKSSRIIEEERRVLELVTRGASLQKILDELTHGIERLAPQCFCSILLLDEDKRRLLRGSGGSLPEEYMRLVHGLEIGPDVGSCGSAAYRNETIVVEDISTDYRWAAAKALPLGFGLQACWSVPIRDSKGGVIGTFAMYHPRPTRPSKGALRLVEASAQLAGNVIERLQAEQRLRELAERLELAEQAASFGIWERGADDASMIGSAGFAALIGAPSGRLSREAFYAMIHPGDRAAVRSTMDSAIAAGESFDVSFRASVRGEIRWLRSQGRVETAGNRSRLIGSTMDITAQKSTLERLELALEAAQAASRAKNEFLGNMSHEIRTPMNGIVGMIELLSDSGLNEEQTDYVETIRQCGESLLHIVNNILDLAKIESGKLDLEKTSFSPAALASEALRIIAVQARDRGLETRAVIDPDIPFAVTGDPLRIKQVLLNLLANAIKFTPCGSVVLGLRTERAGATDPERRVRSVETEVELCFSVADTGIGIAPELRERIFEPFSQADSSTTRRFGGTGLGLTICQRIAALMDGRIELESEPGRGSTFRFNVTLPVMALTDAGALDAQVEPAMQLSESSRS